MRGDANLHLDHATRKDALPCLPRLHSRHPRRAIIHFYQTNPPYVFFINRISFLESSTCQPTTSENQAKHPPSPSNNPLLKGHAVHFRHPRRSGIFSARTKPLYLVFINSISIPESITCQPPAREYQAKHPSPTPQVTGGQEPCGALVTPAGPSETKLDDPTTQC